MTRVVIGGRNRVLLTENTVFVSGAELIANPFAHADAFESASQILWAWYAIDSTGTPDFLSTMRGTETILKHISSYRRPTIMLSTDAVFSGREGRYGEADVAEPVTDYGMIKLAQEGLMSDHPRVRFTTFGPSYSSTRPLLVDMIANGEISVARPFQIFSPIGTPTLNKVLGELSLEPRIYHLTSEAVSKADCCRVLEGKLGLQSIPTKLIDRRQCDLSLKSSTHTFSLANEIDLAIKAWRGFSGWAEGPVEQ